MGLAMMLMGGYHPLVATIQHVVNYIPPRYKPNHLQQQYNMVLMKRYLEGYSDKVHLLASL